VILVLNKKKNFAKLLFLISGLLFYAGFSFAQPVLPQRAITITPSQNIHFGSFCVTGPAGGTVTVGWDGSRTSTGSILLLSMAPTARPAIFDIKLCQGRNVIITFDATAPLTSSGGGTFTMDIGPTEKGVNGASFPTNNDCNFVTILRVGGTLHIPGTSPVGSYTGNFEITFNQE
jgi:Domain of unknown function (DUF4402)